MFTIDALIGQKARVKKVLDATHFIYLISLDHEIWHAVSTHPLKKGDLGIVTQIKGLYAYIHPLNNKKVSS